MVRYTNAVPLYHLAFSDHLEAVHTVLQFVPVKAQ